MTVDDGVTPRPGVVVLAVVVPVVVIGGGASWLAGERR